MILKYTRDSYIWIYTLWRLSVKEKILLACKKYKFHCQGKPSNKKLWQTLRKKGQLILPRVTVDNAWIMWSVILLNNKKLFLNKRTKTNFLRITFHSRYFNGKKCRLCYKFFWKFSSFPSKSFMNYIKNVHKTYRQVDKFELYSWLYATENYYPILLIRIFSSWYSNWSCCLCH